MKVEVRLFAQARERVGSGRAHIELPEGSRVEDALGAMVRAYPGLAELRAHLAVALDGELARADAPLREGCELSLLPPVSGG